MSSLLEPEFAEPYQLWRTTPSPENADNLLKAINPVLTAALRNYAPMPASPTIKSRAKLMALDALGRYDPMQAKLRTHLLFQLQGLRRHAARENQIIQLPEQVGLDLNALHKTEEELKDRLGRDPSDHELSRHAGLSLKRISYIRQAKQPVLESALHSAVSPDDLYSPAVQDDGMAKLWQDFVYQDLAPTDQLIMEHSLGLHGRPVLSTQAIARKLGITSGAVSQRKAKIQAKMNLRDELGVI